MSDATVELSDEVRHHSGTTVFEQLAFRRQLLKTIFWHVTMLTENLLLMNQLPHLFTGLPHFRKTIFSGMAIFAFNSMFNSHSHHLLRNQQSIRIALKIRSVAKLAWLSECARKLPHGFSTLFFIC